MGVAASTFFNWSDENIAILTKAWNNGQSAGEIVKVFKHAVSRSAIIGKCHRLGLSGRGVIAQHHRSRPISATRSVAPRPPRPRPTPKAEAAPRLVAAPLPPVDDLYPTATIMSLGPGMCRWPLGDPQKDGFGFCGRMRPIGVQYCAAHAARCSAPPRKNAAPKDLERSLRRYL